MIPLDLETVIQLSGGKLQLPVLPISREMLVELVHVAKDVRSCGGWITETYSRKLAAGVLRPYVEHLADIRADVLPNRSMMLIEALDDTLRATLLEP
ncbi:hypothetical protein [Actinoplanes regularis]|uniref:hypothetical protein n=1 Tax=Actinoplanes regularis TaxID=52697 RepID=UPI000B776C4B|nr:hypothetical protein [Actinoplanes regularis]